MGKLVMLWPRWMDIETACRYTCRSRNTLKQLVYSGQIKCIQDAGKLYVDREEVDGYLSSKKAKYGGRI